jgi:3-hydroxypropanoate dehydrogenase
MILPVKIEKEFSMSEQAKPKRPLSAKVIEQLFLEARTHNAWLPKNVPTSMIHRLADTLKMAPTSANCSPARIVFVKGKRAKAKLEVCLAPGNVEKTKTAPLTALIGYDLEFYEQLPKLFPHADAKSWFVGNEALIQDTAFRNSSLQGAYLMMAARALGLDCGPMSGFDAAAVEKAFFPKRKIKINFICNLGYGDAKGLFPRSPRFDFDEFCTIV